VFIGCAERGGGGMSFLSAAQRRGRRDEFFIGFFCICCSKICKIERIIIYLQPETIKIEDYGSNNV
jgi:hypothetical protein